MKHGGENILVAHSFTSFKYAESFQTRLPEYRVLRSFRQIFPTRGNGDFTLLFVMFKLQMAAVLLDSVPPVRSEYFYYFVRTDGKHPASSWQNNYNTYYDTYNKLIVNIPGSENIYQYRRGRRLRRPVPGIVTILNVFASEYMLLKYHMV